MLKSIVSYATWWSKGSFEPRIARRIPVNVFVYVLSINQPAFLTPCLLMTPILLPHLPYPPVFVISALKSGGAKAVIHWVFVSDKQGALSTSRHPAGSTDRPTDILVSPVPAPACLTSSYRQRVLRLLLIFTACFHRTRQIQEDEKEAQLSTRSRHFGFGTALTKR